MFENPDGTAAATVVRPIQDSPSRVSFSAYGSAPLQPSDRLVWLLAVQVDKSLPRNAGVVANVLAIFASGSTGRAYPGNDRIAALAGLHRTTTYRILRSLEAAGFVSRTRGGGRGNATEWSLINRSDMADTLDAIETVAETTLNRSDLEGKCSGNDPKPYHHTATPTGNREQVTGKKQKRARPKTKPSKPESTPLPDWLPADAWNKWAKYRTEIRKTLTPSTIDAQLRQLEKLRAAGDDPAAVIEQTIMRGWIGLFPVKHETGGSNGNGKRFETPGDRFNRAAAKVGLVDDGRTIQSDAVAVAPAGRHLRP